MYRIFVNTSSALETRKVAGRIVGEYPCKGYKGIYVPPKIVLRCTRTADSND